MSRDERLYLEDIVTCCEKILRYTADLGFDRFQSSSLVTDAVYRNLEIIGEASKHISLQAREGTANIPWNKITALRNLLAHAYFGLDEEIIWDIVKNYVPDLMIGVQQALSNSSNHHRDD